MWSLQSPREISDQIQSLAEQATETFLNRNDLGFFKPETIAQANRQCEGLSGLLSSFDELVVIGLGGSSLGAQTLMDALLPFKKRSSIHFLDNVDAFTFEQWISELDGDQKRGWLICSKSGGTIEALTLYDYCYQWIFENKNVDIRQSTIVVSEDKDSLVTEFAKAHDCPQLTIPLDVGGRFSVFTPVGLAPAQFARLDLKAFEKGFLWTLDNKTLVTEMVAQLWTSHLASESILYTFQYCDRLQSFGLWLQQLWSESLGKAKKRDQSQAEPVATMVPCRGASDQHSVLQQIIEGPENKMVCFHRVAESEAGEQTLSSSQFSKSLMLEKKLGELLGVQAEATEKAISQSQGGTMVLKTSHLDETSMAGLMMLWMLVTGVLGELLDIDAFNQPGVESGKVITRRVLSQVD